MGVKQTTTAEELEDSCMITEERKVSTGNVATIPKSIRQILDVEIGDEVVWGYDAEEDEVKVAKA
jgi:bifunctional DNA-binding transcriptional regulator/antitoxin component of YhaV-PrlF toxin-antitoxin module